MVDFDELRDEEPRSERINPPGRWRSPGVRWMLVLGVYAVLCVWMVGWPDSREPKQVQMGLYVLSFVFFAMGFFGFFFPLATFSPTARQLALQKMNRPLPRMSFVVLRIVAGVCCVIALLAFRGWFG